MQHLLPEHHQQVLASIRPGMAVYDLHRQQIGTVEEVHFGVVSPYGRGTTLSSDLDQGGTAVEKKGYQEVADDEVSDLLHARMMQHGYVRLASSSQPGSLRSIRPSQIARVDRNGVHLQATEDTLMQD